MLKRWCNKREQRNLMLILFITNIVALILLIIDVSASVKPYHQLKRNRYGQGTKIESLVMSVGKKLKRESIDIKVDEQIYTKKEIKKVFSKCINDLDKLILGNNKSLDKVRKNLNLPNKVPDSPIEITWELGNYEVVNLNGELQVENLVAEGTLVEVKGTLSYKGEKAQYITNVKIYPPIMDKTQKMLANVKKELVNHNNNTKETKKMTLPKKINGEAIVWKKPFQKRSFAISFMGFIIVGLLIALKKQHQIKSEEDRRKQMIIDYPEIINQFTLLVSAGMTVKNAWKKIIDEYQGRLIPGKERYAYEEMRYTCREMQSGVAEGECYERFGYRCKVQNYIKFGSMLSQNVRKGAKGLILLLSAEGAQAFENRKNIAKKLGEEAGTKLLIPMFCMLAIVLVVVIVPAFLSMQV